MPFTAEQFYEAIQDTLLIRALEAGKAAADRLATLEAQHAALLAKVRELPSPILSEPEWREAAKCVWCAAEWTFPDNHPANGCLYVLAHAELQP